MRAIHKEGDKYGGGDGGPDVRRKQSSMNDNTFFGNLTPRGELRGGVGRKTPLAHLKKY